MQPRVALKAVANVCHRQDSEVTGENVTWGRTSWEIKKWIIKVNEEVGSERGTSATQSEKETKVESGTWVKSGRDSKKWWTYTKTFNAEDASACAVCTKNQWQETVKVKAGSEQGAATAAVEMTVQRM
jgi:hypothetical protein